MPADPRFAGVIRKETLNAENRSVGVAFSSESPVEDFPGMPPMVLLHEPQAVDMEGFRNTGSVLWDHDTANVIGRPDDARLDTTERVGRATVVFDEDPASMTVFRKVQSGSVRGVSLRFKVEDGFVLRSDEKWTSPGGKQFAGPVAVVTKWTPREISLTPIPADQSVGVGRSLSFKEAEMPLEKIRAMLFARGLVAKDATDEDVMRAFDKFTATPPEKPPEDGAGQPAQTPPPPAAPPASNAVELMEFARKLGTPDDALDWVKRGLTMEQVRTIALDRLIANSPKIDGTQRVEVGQAATDKFFAAHGAVMARRVNTMLQGKLKLSDEEMKLGQDVMPDLTLEEFIRRTLEQMGVRGARSQSKDWIAHRGLAIVSDVSRAAQHSTSDFPAILENIANKSLAAGFNEAPTTYQIWSGTLSVSDFKTHTVASLSEAEEFVINPELMPISESTVADKKETYAIQTYARKFGLSRQAIINDDLDAFSRYPNLFGSAAARTMNSVFYATFLAGKTMAEDAKALFATDHTSGSNLESGAAIDDTQLADAKKLMRMQKGFNPNTPARLNLTPRYLLIPSALEHTTLKLLTGTFMPTAYTSAIPNWIGQLQLIVEPALDANSTTAFYLLADPGTIRTVSAVYLGGNRTPQIMRNDGTSILGVEWYAYFDFGVAILEHRGMVKHTGAA